MATLYLTVAELRAAIQKTSAADDAYLLQLCNAASEAVDRITNRPDGYVALAVATARRFNGRGLSWLRIDECTAVTKVEVMDSPTDTAYQTWLATDYLKARGDPERPEWDATPYDLLLVDPTGDQGLFTDGRMSYTRGFRPSDEHAIAVPTCRVTANWGFATTVPYEIKIACIAQSARWYKRSQSAWADTLANSEVGTLLYTKPLDPDVQFLTALSRFVRPAVA